MSKRLLTLAVAVALSPVSARLRHPHIRPDQGTNRPQERMGQSSSNGVRAQVTLISIGA